MSIRNLVYDALRTDATLNGLGINAGTLYPNFTPDSPSADKLIFAVIRWGTADAPPGRDTTARTVAVTIWVYDRSRSFGNIEPILQRVRTVLRGLEGAAHTGGAVLGVTYDFSSEDLYDTDYDAVVRNETYSIAASGT